MKYYSRKYIITGAPGTGKTTLLEALKFEGYLCMDEISRKVIQSQQQGRSDGTPWQNLSKFTELVYLEFVDKLNGNPEAIFTDRSPLDLIAYHLLEGKPVPSFLDDLSYHEKFHRKVFFAPVWKEIFEQDEQRQQTFEYGVELETVLLETYREKNFEVVMIPKETVPLRVNFVQESINIAGA